MYHKSLYIYLSTSRFSCSSLNFLLLNPALHFTSIRDFKIQRRRRQREHQINNRFYNQNNNFARATLFLYIFCPFLQGQDVKMPNSTFYGGRKQATTKFSFSFCARIWFLGIQLQGGSPTFDKVTG